MESLSFPRAPGLSTDPGDPHGRSSEGQIEPSLYAAAGATRARQDPLPPARADTPATTPRPAQSPEAAPGGDTKVCVKCKQEKSVLDFHKNSRSADGLHSYCKECNKAQALAHIRAEKARKALLRAARKAAAGTTE
ncbi:hypothetical protein [Accumulibacter sp.]|uniref:hypothetical protein n=1 Tax=Accumulibacter sp. TaxID=2053492 RepID=UPI0025CECF33|nr:hypothetical protein [Accumulibacter sp.]MCM8596202.1 hypothetical protein [Accumulibacter sp.]MCM8627810.1 hypothetical protein [Accumulibacter sp.]MDS4050351.1 hypothetical protein [Accumulibacter sp.]